MTIHVIASLGATVLLTAVFYGTGVRDPTVIALSYLLVVLVVATLSRRWIAITTSLMSFLCYNLFFLPPVGTLTVADPTHLVALLTLLAVSIVASHLAAEARRWTEEATSRAREGELKSALLAALDHDLKTPLTALTVAAENLNAPWLDDDGRREQLQILRTELARLNRLFSQIVEMARIRTRGVRPEPEWVRPADIIDAALAQCADTVRGRPLDVAAGDDGLLVRVDPRLTTAALAHLLQNAGQYSPPSAPIAVSARTGGGELLLRVRDAGPGVGSQPERLFEPFYRGEDARRVRAGTGMGLAITRGLLAAQGGRVTAADHPDGGAVFTMAVPVATRRLDAPSEEGEP